MGTNGDAQSSASIFRDGRVPAQPRALALGGGTAVLLLGATEGGIPSLLTGGKELDGFAWTAVALAGAVATIIALFAQSDTYRWVAAALWLMIGLAAIAPGTLTGFVGPAECLVLASLTASNPRSSRAVIAPIAPTGMMLALFGLIHLIEAPAIASLIPLYFPGRASLPYLSGTLMLVAGITAFSARARRVLFLAVAAMFASWLPLVHLARLAEDPRSLFEWQFATMALALTAALVAASGLSRARAAISPAENP